MNTTDDSPQVFRDDPRGRFEITVGAGRQASHISSQRTSRGRPNASFTTPRSMILMRGRAWRLSWSLRLWTILRRQRQLWFPSAPT